ncbi:hypothetical protein LINPERHAP1_LOCUS9762, partial [Linum perenne]
RIELGLDRIESVLIIHRITQKPNKIQDARCEAYNTTKFRQIISTTKHSKPVTILSAMASFISSPTKTMAQPLPCFSSSSISRTTSSSYLPHIRRRDDVSTTVPIRSSRRNTVSCCSITTTTTSSATSEQVWEVPEKQFENLTAQFGWRVRRMVNNPTETKEVAQVQAEAFHTPVALFDFVFFEFFKAEVLSGLLYKLRNSTPDRYACLVAEPAAKLKFVGVADATAARDAEVLKYLIGVQEYLYISGIAVLSSFRRRKVGSVLLNACDNVARLWGFEYLALQAYADDMGARALYAKAGYRVASSDPQWFTLIGRRPRVLMIKRL